MVAEKVMITEQTSKRKKLVVEKEKVVEEQIESEKMIKKRKINVSNKKIVRKLRDK